MRRSDTSWDSETESINEAFVYCIIGSQVSVRSSVLGLSESAKEAQHEFLLLV